MAVTIVAGTDPTEHLWLCTDHTCVGGMQFCSVDTFTIVGLRDIHERKENTVPAKTTRPYVFKWGHWFLRQPPPMDNRLLTHQFPVADSLVPGSVGLVFIARVVLAHTRNTRTEGPSAR